MSYTIEAFLPTAFGLFDIHSIPSSSNPYAPSLVLVSKDIREINYPILRIHSECLTGDVFGSLRCDCGFQLKSSMAIISKEGGILIYLRQEGRGIGLHHKIEAYQMQDNGLDTVEANVALGFEPDSRNYDEAINILMSFDIKAVRLLTNNPKKMNALISAGIKVIERIPLLEEINSFNKNYLSTKKDKLGHLLP